MLRRELNRESNIFRSIDRRLGWDMVARFSFTRVRLLPLAMLCFHWLMLILHWRLVSKEVTANLKASLLWCFSRHLVVDCHIGLKYVFSCVERCLHAKRGFGRKNIWMQIQFNDSFIVWIDARSLVQRLCLHWSRVASELSTWITPIECFVLVIFILFHGILSF